MSSLDFSLPSSTVSDCASTILDDNHTTMMLPHNSSELETALNLLPSPFALPPWDLFTLPMQQHQADMDSIDQLEDQPLPITPPFYGAVEEEGGGEHERDTFPTRTHAEGLHEEDVDHAYQTNESLHPSVHSTAVSVSAPFQLQPTVVTTATVLYPPLTSDPIVAPPSIKFHACIACRSHKVSCDHSRPCRRCVRSQRPCVDRSEEDRMEAKARQKRRAPTSNANTTNTNNTNTSSNHKHAREGSMATEKLLQTSEKRRMVRAGNNSSGALPWQHPAAPIPALVSTLPPGAPFKLLCPSSFTAYSAILLQACQRRRIRDKILALHSLLSSLPPSLSHLPSLLSYPVHGAMCLMHVAETLTPADARKFFTEGLAPEVLESTLYCTSPLEQWSKKGSRLMRTEWVDVDPDEVADSENADVRRSSSTTLPQMVFEWLPGAQATWAAVSDRVVFRSATDPFATAKVSTDLNSASYITRRNALTQLAALSAASREQQRPSREASSSSSDELPDSADLDNVVQMLASLNVADINRALSNNQEGDMVSESSSRSADSSDADSAVSSSQSKPASHAIWCDFSVAQRESMTPTASSVPSAISQYCTCQQAAGLPARVLVNSGFERLFGLSQAEVSAGLKLEGKAWLRHLHPPSEWHNLAESKVIQCETVLNVMTAMAQTAVDTAARVSSEEQQPGSSTSTSMVSTPVEGQNPVHEITAVGNSDMEGSSQPIDEDSPAVSQGAAPSSNTRSPKLESSAGGGADSASQCSASSSRSSPLRTGSSNPPFLSTASHRSHRQRVLVQNRWGGCIPCVQLKLTPVPTSQPLHRAFSIVWDVDTMAELTQAVQQSQQSPPSALVEQTHFLKWETK